MGLLRLSNNHFLRTLTDREDAEGRFGVRSYLAVTGKPYKTFDPVTCKQTGQIANAIAQQKDNKGEGLDLLNIPGSDLDNPIFTRRDDRQHEMTSLFKSMTQPADTSALFASTRAVSILTQDQWPADLPV